MGFRRCTGRSPSSPMIRRTTFSEMANGSASSMRSSRWMVRMAPHAAALLEQTAYPFAQNGVLVPGPHGRALVVAGAATERHGIEHGLEAEPAPDPFHDPRLLPVRRPARVEARAAGFYNRDRPRHRVLQTQRGDLPFQPHRIVAPVVY